MSRPWGLFGPVPVPFVEASVALTDATQVLRAGLVSFAMVFGLRLVGGRLREAVDQVRGRVPAFGLLADTALVAVVVAGAVWLAGSTAQMQEALLRIQAGGTSLDLPGSVLYSIVAFMLAVSLACGYFLNEPEAEQARQWERRVKDTGMALATAVAAENSQKGIVRATRERLRGLDRQEQLVIDEQNAHTEHEVAEHKAANHLIYGLEMADQHDANDDDDDTTGDESGG
jgi:hypothetical protein